MYWRCNNGGKNRTHGTVEKMPRIDSFNAGAIAGCGILSTHQDGTAFFFDCSRYVEYGEPEDREIVELWDGDRSQILELSQKQNGFGGSQAFFLCPFCGQRVRYLYLSHGAFRCRRCAQLNYRSQQETRSGTMHFYDKGLAFAERHFDCWPMVRPNGFDFVSWIPDRPRYMHQTTYRRYLRRFMRYRERHADRQMQDLKRILKI